jgi:hypothetical protein
VRRGEEGGGGERREGEEEIHICYSRNKPQNIKLSICAEQLVLPLPRTAFQNAFKTHHLTESVTAHRQCGHAQSEGGAGL